MKNTMVQFLVNDEEKALIERCAEKANLTVSEYIRASLLNGDGHQWRGPGAQDHRPNHRHEGHGCFEPTLESESCG